MSDEYSITDPRVLLAGGAIFTIASPSGDHYTYRVAHSRQIKVYYDTAEAAREDLAKFKGGQFNGKDSYSGKYVVKVGIRDFQDTEIKKDLQHVSVHAPLYVSVLTGPENMSDYSYAGILEGEKIRLTANTEFPVKGKFQGEWVNEADWNKALQMRKLHDANGEGPKLAKSLEVILWAFYLLNRGKTLPDGYRIYHMGQCCRCGRALTVPSSIESGLGPYCAGKVFG